MTTPTTRIYALGGTGLNIGQQFSDVKPSAFAAIPEFAYLDSAMSNVKDCEPYLVPDVDGTGKDRKAAYNVIDPEINPFLAEYKPGTFNIILCNLSGGTGSTAAHLIATKLAQRGVSFIILGVGNTLSETETANTINTLIGLNAMSKKLGRAFPIMYFENSNKTDSPNKGSIPDVNSKVCGALANLLMLVSGNNENLDSKDVENFLDYTVKTKTKAQLTDILYMEAEEERYSSYTSKVVSTVSLLNSLDDPEPSLNQAYGSVGYYPEEMKDKLKPILWVSTIGLISGRLLALTERKNELDNIEQQRALLQKEEQDGLSSLENISDDEGGMCF